MKELVFKKLNLFSKEKDASEDSIPINIECEEILLIFGPSLKFMTNHENSNDEDNLDDHEESREYVDLDTYDSLHYLRVVESRLKHRMLVQK